MKLNFYVVDRWYRPLNGTLCVYLARDNWDDYGYCTLYYVTIFDEVGKKYDLGYTKIACFGQKGNTQLCNSFNELDNEYFSLGQDENYYEIIYGLNSELKEVFLKSIKDIVYDNKLGQRALQEEVTKTSLMRFIGLKTLNEQFTRILSNGIVLTEFHFLYPLENESLTFDVMPESTPPTNIHIFIGRNGVGKTRLLNDMARHFINEYSKSKIEFGYEANNPFSKIVLVSYSAFDSLDLYGGEYCSYIGLKKQDSENVLLKNKSELSKEFATSVLEMGPQKMKLWGKAIKNLESDPVFESMCIENVVCKARNDKNKTNITNLFGKLSSGHSIVLLTITKIVEKIEEKTLILIDEPETHLHPPLQSAFVRTLSDLLIKKNAVAIIATHSPIIVQEVPKSCIWKLDKVGDLPTRFSRFDIETFGESIGTLINEIFGLEVTKTGFYKMLSNEVESDKTYDSIFDLYKGQLGFEARLILKALMNNKIMGNTKNDTTTKANDR